MCIYQIINPFIIVNIEIPPDIKWLPSYILAFGTLNKFMSETIITSTDVKLKDESATCKFGLVTRALLPVDLHGVWVISNDGVVG